MRTATEKLNGLFISIETRIVSGAANMNARFFFFFLTHAKNMNVNICKYVRKYTNVQCTCFVYLSIFAQLCM